LTFFFESLRSKKGKMKSERRGKFGERKALAFAVLFATLAFVSVGCASANLKILDCVFKNNEKECENRMGGSNEK
jgi:hypothetical protein